MVNAYLTKESESTSNGPRLLHPVPMQSYNEIGKILREAREAKGLTQGDIATKLGITKQGVSLIEHGRSKPPLDRLEAFASLVGVSLVVEAIPPTDERKVLAASILAHIDEFPETVIDALSAWSEKWLPKPDNEDGRQRA